MTKEELLKPRWKVIADYPFAPSIHAVGTIIEGSLAPEGIESWENKYPHLFKKLEWWQERKEKDMPEYLKSSEGEVYKVEVWRGSIANINRYGVISMHLALNRNNITPATEEEYNEYLKSEIT